MKKFFVLPMALLLAGTALAAATTSVAELNAEIAKILAPFQNDKTEAALSFSKIETNADRALSAAVSLLYKKTGSQNTLKVSLPELSYEYGDGSAPTTKGMGEIGLDLTKILPQDQINELIPDLEFTIMELAKGFTQDYGDAVTVQVEITEKNQDANGNYVSLKGSLSFAFDFTKLPDGKSASEIPVASGRAEIGLDVNSGLVFNFNVVSNTAFSGFQENNQGLKEYLDALMAKDAAMLGQFQGLMEQLDSFANEFVNGNQL